MEWTSSSRCGLFALAPALYYEDEGVLYDEDTVKQDDFIVQEIEHLVAGQTSRVTKPLMKLEAS